MKYHLKIIRKAQKDLDMYEKNRYTFPYGKEKGAFQGIFPYHKER